jgi:hypothetical protein
MSSWLTGSAASKVIAAGIISAVDGCTLGKIENRRTRARDKRGT